MPDATKKKLSFIINVCYVALILLLLYIFFKVAIYWILPFILAFLLVSIFNPFIKKINAKIHINQKMVAIGIMVIVYALVGVVIFFAVFKLIFFLKDILLAMPSYYEENLYPTMIKTIDWANQYIASLPIEWQEPFNYVQEGLLKALPEFFNSLSQKGIQIFTFFTNQVPSFIIGLIFTIMLSFFISVQFEDVINFMLLQLPDKTVQLLKKIRQIFAQTVLQYIKAYMIIMVITLIELSVGFLIIGVKNPFGIAAFIAIFDALPVFGTGAIMIPWILIELVTGSVSFSSQLLVLYLIVTLVRNIIEPKIVGDQLGLNPVVSLMAIYFGFKVFGVLGMIMMPIAVQIFLALHMQKSLHWIKLKDVD